MGQTDEKYEPIKLISILSSISPYIKETLCTKKYAAKSVYCFLLGKFRHPWKSK